MTMAHAAVPTALLCMSQVAAAAQQRAVFLQQQHDAALARAAEAEDEMSVAFQATADALQLADAAIKRADAVMRQDMAAEEFLPAGPCVIQPVGNDGAQHLRKLAT